MHDARAAPDDGRTANHGAFHDRPLFDDDFPLDAAFGVHRAVDPTVERLENQPVRFEHVFELAGVLPPAVDDIGAHTEPAIDQVLDGIGDFKFVPEAWLDAVD